MQINNTFNKPLITSRPSTHACVIRKEGKGVPLPFPLAAPFEVSADRKTHRMTLHSNFKTSEVKSYLIFLGSHLAGALGLLLF